jgi:rod shape determining protein RodA
MIYSASHHLADFHGFYARQLIWMGISLAGMMLTLSINYQTILRHGYGLHLIAILLLLAALLFGPVVRGAQRWILIGPLSFAPAEFAKITVVLSLAYYLGNTEEANSLKKIFVSFLIVFIPFILIFSQPDLGTALILLPTFLVMLYLAGVKKQYLLTIVLFGVLVVTPVVYYFFLEEYQRARIHVLLNPGLDPLGASFSINQSRIAIGSGGILGRGWLGGSQTQLHFLPAQYTDFIFSVVGEEWGFIGSLGLLLLYIGMFSRGVRIACEAKDRASSFLAAGLTTMLVSHVFVNIGMTLGIVPADGLPLPFLSYGGSSLLATMLSVGLLLNIHMRRFII